MAFPVQTNYGNEYKAKQKALSPQAPTSEKQWKRSWKLMDEVPEWIKILEELRRKSAILP